ncbi:MAG TPA: AbgT family transporter [Longimicrobiales bacterium]|nr:AbgT family transporter [Longimicrobiales bacterium]
MPRLAQPAPSDWLSRSLTFIERVGNALPHPGPLFALMALFVIVASAITAQFDWWWSMRLRNCIMSHSRR